MVAVAVLIVVLCATSVAGQGQLQLQVGYYNKTCPAAEQIVRNETTAAIQASPDLAAALLRLHYHDCFVQVHRWRGIGYYCWSAVIIYICISCMRSSL
jgi:peroxidase